MKIIACGVCGSDVHTATGGWGNKIWPVVPGHGEEDSIPSCRGIADVRNVEIIGHAVKVGSKVTTVKVGDRVGVGAQIYACLECDACKEDNETYCKKLLGKFHRFCPLEYWQC